MGNQIKRVTRGEWEYFFAATVPPYEIAGKYLFFSVERDRLVKITIEELEGDTFHHAKIPIAVNNN